MLHSQVDASNADGQSEEIAVENSQSDNTIKCPVLNLQSSEGNIPLPNLQASDLVQQVETTQDESFEVVCNLPSLPIDTLLAPFNIINRLRKHSEVKDLLPFQCGLGELSLFGKADPSFWSKCESSKESKNTMPYFIPELEMACSDSQVEQIEEVAENKDTTKLKIELLKIQQVEVPNLVLMKESNLAPNEEQNTPQLEELNLLENKEIGLPRNEESVLPVTKDIRESKIEQSDPQGQQLKSPGIVAPITLQIEELVAPLVEKAKPGPKFGIISSLVGNKATWTPNVRLSFGDRETRWTKTRPKEIIQQEASRSLKALILSLNMLKRLEASFNDNSYKNRLNRFERIRSSLNFSRVFRQNIFQLTPAAESSRKEVQENSMGCGEPMMRGPSKEPPLPIMYRIDASEGLTCNGLNVSKDSVFSDVSESDDSEVLNKSSQEVIGLTKTIADIADTQQNGRILFSQPVRLFCFNKLKEWKRQGKVPGSVANPYRSPSFSGEGQIEIWELHGLYYIILHDRITGELIIHMRVDEKWRIDYMSNSSYSCRWTNINYAFCRKGILERIACSFREPSHAAEFVARVRNSALLSRFE
ncbi:uncharacterized protein LOC128260041 isoform X1 [Drosophila gunungcola]|uniref:uncharacterized protein LOC128260041 isoform X1 n=2 Tax=Drosophila gunungcola TaxID=103775 RepID=UPI0022DFAE64|nr:uncharacterized protein LOC128260041 isoform X1 [Drosophila gunungcola]